VEIIHRLAVAAQVLWVAILQSIQATVVLVGQVCVHQLVDCLYFMLVAEAVRLVMGRVLAVLVAVARELELLVLREFHLEFNLV
jgi:hypothetical protein